VVSLDRFVYLYGAYYTTKWLAMLEHVLWDDV
jgi:hypothetical protein